MRLRAALALCALWLAACAAPQRDALPAPHPRAIVFYYNWYGSPEHDGARLHWAHPVLKLRPQDPDSPEIPGGGDIAADFYPALGEYSSADPAVAERHMAMIAQAGIGVVAVTWLGREDPSYRSLRALFDAAARHGLRICFQIEPASRPTLAAARAQLLAAVDDFGRHPAFYRDPGTGRPLFFVYDSYQLPASDWARLLRAGGAESIRGGAYDADVIGLWVQAGEGPYFLASGFDGVYTYFASRGFTWGSTPEHWPQLQRWADEHGLRFIPSVGPGYSDRRVRPWNRANERGRQDGAYYDAMFAAAADSGAQWVSITSFNEWHEGTQLEPAAPRDGAGRYSDYAPLPPDHYLRRTRYWLSRFPTAPAP
ncbi:glycoside hydrolase family 99 protein [Lysobacter silvisoli]|uniref:Alpha-mannosidase n=1 Tax=Lysobacter silvisoli TaxID=2293254 RepID=A0A371JZA7_9GAMM|nr:glycoside hydrolase family 99 protein [Lysobacter silvisoli]RDZ27001.1 alpha-mannosidase [Lysobacter silvisoli]